jgi:N-acetylmuramoyl-L-alanine amidase
MNKVAILIGHRSKRKGAYSEWMDVFEYDYNKKVASYLTDIADIYERPNTYAVSEGYRIRQVVNKINKRRYDLVISLHFNSFKNSKAHGATALHYVTNVFTKNIGKHFIELCHQQFGSRERNLIPITSKNQRGGTFITGIKSPAILLEPFFGSSPAECVEFINAEEKYANLLRDLICNI